MTICSRTLFLAAGLAALASISRTARAEHCGVVSNGWNAPNGAAVFEHKPTGPINGVIDELHEYRTHVMVSHGPGGWVSHATSDPTINTSYPGICSKPLDPERLANGYPGASQVNDGAIYDFTDGSDFLRYQRGTNGSTTTPYPSAAVADWLWNTVPYQGKWSENDSSQSFYVLGRNDISGFHRFVYSFYQYKDSEGVTSGTPAHDDGMVCSTFVGWAQRSEATGFMAVSPHTYEHDLVAAAADALYTGTYDYCRTKDAWYKTLGSAVGCLDTDLCDEVADQTVNCMASDTCDSSDGSKWKAIRDNPAETATSLSPDRLGGWSGHPTSGIGSSYWAPDPDYLVQWNAPGSVYGCWD